MATQRTKKTVTPEEIVDLMTTTTPKESTMNEKQINITPEELRELVVSFVNESLKIDPENLATVSSKSLSDDEAIPPNLKKYFVVAQGGKQYLTVAGRLVWFRDVHPDWDLFTEVVKVEWDGQKDDYAICRCDIYRPVLNEKTGETQMFHVSSATKTETRQGFGDFLEKAETGSVGRALALLGFGTQFAQELDEKNRIVDSPQPSQPQYAQGGYQGTSNRQTNNMTAQAKPAPRTAQKPKEQEVIELIGSDNAKTLEENRLKAGIADEKWTELCIKYLKVPPVNIENLPIIMYGRNMIDAMGKVISDNANVKTLI